MKLLAVMPVAALLFLAGCTQQQPVEFAFEMYDLSNHTLLKNHTFYVQVSLPLDRQEVLEVLRAGYAKAGLPTSLVVDSKLRENRAQWYLSETGPDAMPRCGTQVLGRTLVRECSGT
ncbi:hypothetical protein HYS54_01485 [Candidatus Micrarchaeota archaeon]|nr:hypothetical protein [Candidatus Micrarchaeota archaeon]